MITIPKGGMSSPMNSNASTSKVTKTSKLTESERREKLKQELRDKVSEALIKILFNLDVSF